MQQENGTNQVEERESDRSVDPAPSTRPKKYKLTSNKERRQLLELIFLNGFRITSV
jgi:hypothetical protein